MVEFAVSVVVEICFLSQFRRILQPRSFFAEKLYQRRFSPVVSRRSVDQVTAARIHHSHSIVDLRAVV